MSKISLIVFAVAIVGLADLVMGTIVPSEEWATYKAKYNKVYTDLRAEAFAKKFYAFNKLTINNLNALNARRTYKLSVNQFTDMRPIDFNNLFTLATPTKPSQDSPPPPIQQALSSYDPIKDFGFTSIIENQGTKCNSGWAYAAAKSVELLKAYQAGDKNPRSLSAQNLIDCAGRAIACTRQEPQSAFDYLTQYNMGLLLETDYINNNTLSEPAMCTPRGQSAANLMSYSRLTDGDDESLKAYVSNGFPVVVEFNPTSFDFMNYAGGIFQQPATSRGSHFMVVIGYGTDATTGLDYWLLQNSFGTDWGENGLMKLLRNDKMQLTKNAIFPKELA